MRTSAPPSPAPSPAAECTDCPVTVAREQLSDLVNRAMYAGRPTYLIRRGKRVAAIVPVAHADAFYGNGD